MSWLLRARNTAWLSSLIMTNVVNQQARLKRRLRASNTPTSSTSNTVCSSAEPRYALLVFNTQLFL